MHHASLKKTEVEPIEPVQMKIYQINKYRKEFNWLHFNNETRVQ